MAKVKIDIVGDAAGAQRAFRQAGDSARGFGKQMGTLAKAGLIGAAVGGTALLVKGLKDSVGAAMEAEKAQAALEAQLKASGVSFEKNAKFIESGVQSLSRMSGMDDEALTGAFTRLVRSTGDAKAAMQQMALVADLARGKNMDVAKAADVVGKVLDGNTSILNRYGVSVEKGATVQEALAAAQSKFAGQAKAYGDTAAGAQDKFRVAVENLQETVGAKLLPQLNKLFVWGAAQMPKLSAFFDTHSAQIESVLAKISSFINLFLVPRFKQMQAIGQSAIAGVRKVFDENGPQIRQILSAIEKVVIAVGTAMNFLVTKIVIPVLKPMLEKVLPTALGIALHAIADVVKVTEKLIDAWKWVGEKAVSIWKKVSTGVAGPAESVAAALQPIASVIAAIANAMQSVVRNAGKFISAVDQIKNAASSVGGAIGRVIPDLPGRATGGPVTAGMPYVVGERGPELFVPNVSGHIVPNNQTTGTARQASTVVNVSFPNYVGSRDDLIRTVREGLADVARRNPGALPGIA